MDRPFFIIMYSQNGKMVMPIIQIDEYGNEDVAIYSSEDEARKVADDHEFCMKSLRWARVCDGLQARRCERTTN